MRTIKKRASPAELEEWRAQRIAHNNPELYPFDYEAMRRNKPVLRKVEDVLFAEQGQICAYSGRRITRQGRQPESAGFHIEHLKPQHRCDQGEDCAYENLVACWPEPNQAQAVEYGAVKKDDWPQAGEDDLFVSPLHEGCKNRFRFVERQDPQVPGEEPKWSNWMEPAAPEDNAAETTISKLNLNHPELRALRRAAVFGALMALDGAAWTLAELKVIHTGFEQAENNLDAGADVQLDAFCFAIRQALTFQIQQLQEPAGQ